MVGSRDSRWEHTASLQIFQATFWHPSASLTPLEGVYISAYGEPSVWKLGIGIGTLPSQLSATTSLPVCLW